MYNQPESFQDGKYLTAKAKGAIALAIFIFAILWITGIFHQIKTPGSFLEKGEYAGNYYVLVFPDEHGVKNYKVPADFSRTCDEDGDGGCTESYTISSITFPNGGSPELTDCHPQLKVKTLCIANDEASTNFYIQLTSEKVR